MNIDYLSSTMEEMNGQRQIREYFFISVWVKILGFTGLGILLYLWLKVLILSLLIPICLYLIWSLAGLPKWLLSWKNVPALVLFHCIHMFSLVLLGLTLPILKMLKSVIWLGQFSESCGLKLYERLEDGNIKLKREEIMKKEQLVEDFREQDLRLVSPAELEHIIDLVQTGDMRIGLPQRDKSIHRS